MVHALQPVGAQDVLFDPVVNDLVPLKFRLGPSSPCAILGLAITNSSLPVYCRGTGFALNLHTMETYTVHVI